MSRSIDVDINVREQGAIGIFQGIGQSIGQAGMQLVQAGISAAIDAIGNSIELASDKAEAASKVNVLFADSADQIHAAAEQAATTVGLSSGAYEEAAGNLGNLLTNFGLTSDAAAGMSVDMIQLAADLGSFNNADPTEVVEAMGAAFRGESEPIRRFGIMLDEATVKNKALELGLYDGVGALDKAARAQATYALIVDQSASAAGDFARTSDGLANSQRINAARMEDAWTRVGEKLMPLVNAVLPMIADAIVGVVDAIDAVLGWIGDWIADNQDLVDSLVDVGRIILGALETAFGWLVDILGEIGYRIGGVIGLFIDLAGAIIDGGAAIVKVLSGDFEGAAEDAQRALERLGSFQENVQRAIGDQARRTADAVEASTRAASEAAIRASDDTESRIQESWARQAEAAAQGADDIGTYASDGLAGALGDGTPKVRSAADDLASTIPDELSDAQREAVRIASKTPGELASEMRSNRSEWQDALKTLGDDLENAMTRAQEIGELEAALTGKRLAKGLASADPIVREQAEETKRLIEARLIALRSGAYDLGATFVDRYTSAIRDGRDDVARAITYSFGRQLAGQSPPPEGPLHDLERWAVNDADVFLEAWSRRMMRSRDLNLGALAEGLSSRPPVDGSSAAGPTIYIQVGVGDPVAIGREVDQVLQAYYRSSGTEV